MTRRYNKNDATAAGCGAHQSPAMLVSQRRYRARKAGFVLPLEYIELKDVAGVLE